MSTDVRPAVLGLFGVFGGFFLFACGDGEDSGPDPRDPLCDEEILIEAPLEDESSPASQALLLVEERTGVAGATVRSHRLRTLFFDLSNFEGTPAEVLNDSPSCFRVVGQPVSSGRATPLSVRDVRVEGLANGDRDIGMVTGTFMDEDTRLGSGPLTFAAMPNPDALATFPAVRLSVEQPPALTGMAGRAVSLDGFDFFELRWDAPPSEDQTYIEIAMLTEDPAVSDSARRNRVVCRVRDDGCHRVPRGSLDWLSIFEPVADIEVNRHAVAMQDVDESSLAAIDVARGAQGEVDLDSLDVR